MGWVAGSCPSGVFRASLHAEDIRGSACRLIGWNLTHGRIQSLSLLMLSLNPKYGLQREWLR